jgi:hypothetical protein
MAITINAKTSGAGGLETTADNTGNINIQSGGSTVMSISSTGVSVTGSFSQDGAVYSTQPTFRNLIINGDMKIAQRATSASSYIYQGYATVDRFLFNVGNGLGTWTISQDTDVPSGQGFATSSKLLCTTANASPAANAFLTVVQKIEAQNLQQLAFGTANAKSLTASFWVKSNKTGTYVLMMYRPDSGRLLSKTYTINAANTWEKKTITVVGDTTGSIPNDNGDGLNLYWHLGDGTDRTSGTANTDWGAYSTPNEAAGQTVNLGDATSNYFNITGVQLEVGSTATDFEFLPIDVQLRRCQRYYEKSIPYNVGSPISQTGSFNQIYIARSTPANYGIYYNQFTVEKRANPSIQVYGYDGTLGQISNADSGANIGAGSAIHNNTLGFVTKNNSGVTISAQQIAHNWTADSEL